MAREVAPHQPVSMPSGPTSVDQGEAKVEVEQPGQAVLFDEDTYHKLLSEVLKYKQITPSVLS